MKVVYVVGPYRAPTEWQVSRNIQRAEAIALEVWKLGAACICPHKNTAYFGGAADDDVWLQGDQEIVRRCDALICTSDWEESAGSRGEVKLAEQLRIPVFKSLGELQKWLNCPPSTPAGGAFASGRSI